MFIKTYCSLFLLLGFILLYAPASIDHHLEGENGWQFRIYWSLILNYVCL